MHVITTVFGSIHSSFLVLWGTISLWYMYVCPWDPGSSRNIIFKELLDFRTSPIVRHSKMYKTQRFGNWICFGHWIPHVQSSELLYDWRFTANQFVLARSPLRTTTRISIFQLNTCGYSPYVISSLTRGWICRLQLLLGLASAVILRSEFHGNHDHRLHSQIRDSPRMECQVPVFIYPRNGVAQLYSQAVVLFPSPPTTRRAMVEVFESSSTRNIQSQSDLLQLFKYLRPGYVEGR
jgi:hypothetical protein